MSKNQWIPLLCAHCYTSIAESRIFGSLRSYIESMFICKSTWILVLAESVWWEIKEKLNIENE
jgi:hypothetical protein